MKKQIKNCTDKEIYTEAYVNSTTSTTKLSCDNCKFCSQDNIYDCGILCNFDMSIIDFDLIRKSEYQNEEIEVEE